MESEYQTVGQMYERLRLMIRQRNDTGFRLARDKMLSWSRGTRSNLQANDGLNRLSPSPSSSYSSWH
jgi:hypothetical protein